jgi:hypothetical protein
MKIMIRTQIQLTEEQARALKEAAHRENASIAELTRRAIDQWLLTTAAAPAGDRRQRALAVVGRFRSGKTDVSERHDDYLAEAYDA